MTTYWYRYEDHRVSDVDEWNNICNSRAEIYLRKYPLLKLTPKGGWINVYGERRFVLLTARKKFALPTIEQAKESFIARKNAQIRIYSRHISHAREALSKIEWLPYQHIEHA